MSGKVLKKIISEEIHNFDFLSMDEVSSFDNSRNLLNSKEFQTQFVNDVISDMNNENKFKNINTQYSHMSNDRPSFIDGEKLDIQFDFDIEYNYNGNDISLTLIFDGENINYDLDVDRSHGTNDLPSTEDVKLNNVDWSDINCNLFTTDGEEIDMSWLNNSKLHHLFVKNFVEPIISAEL